MTEEESKDISAKEIKKRKKELEDEFVPPTHAAKTAEEMEDYADRREDALRKAMGLPPVEE